MTDLIYDYITTAVDMVISAAILSSVVMLLYTSSRLSVEIINSQSTADTLAYYMQFNQYDNEEVITSDVISALVKFADEVEIVVYDTSNNVVVHTTGNGYIYEGNGATEANIIRKRPAEISAVIGNFNIYHATLNTVGNTAGIGAIESIVFNQK